VFSVLTRIYENAGLNTQLNRLAPVSATPIFPGICRIVVAASIKRQSTRMLTPFAPGMFYAL
jgi:hypothetical protein